MSVAIIDYGSGNLRSAAKAFERAAADRGLGETISVTDDPEKLRKAERIVLPGVGAFADCMAGLSALPGMVDALDESVRKAGKPFFGICVGAQLLAARGLEHGVHKGLGWLGGDVVRIEPKDAALKVPHMGWNDLRFRRPHPVFDGFADGAQVYFVHSFVFKPATISDVIAEADHGDAFPAAFGRDNIVGTQFHPEKSQANGLRIIGNFLSWRP